MPPRIPHLETELEVGGQKHKLFLLHPDLATRPQISPRVGDKKDGEERGDTLSDGKAA